MGFKGVLRHDRRVLSELVVEVDGHEPVPVGHNLTDASRATFVGVLRHLGDRGADPTVRLERVRVVRPDGADEQVRLANTSRSPLEVTVSVRVGVDLAVLNDLRHGDELVAVPPTSVGPATATWSSTQVDVTVRASEANLTGAEAGAGSRPGANSASDATAAGPTPRPLPSGAAEFGWDVTVPARSTWSVQLHLDLEDSPQQTPTNVFLPAAAGPGWDQVSVSGPDTLARLVDRSVDDLAALALADPLATNDVFLAAGSPWFFTLFGRDSLWAARLTLPLGTDLAGGTLRTLARRQGTRHDPDTAEAAGQDPARDPRRNPCSSAAAAEPAAGLLRHRRRHRRCGSASCTTPGAGACRPRRSTRCSSTR